MNDKATWLTYEFTIYEKSAQWNNVGGIYIFTGLNQQDRWLAYYIGQADSF